MKHNKIIHVLFLVVATTIGFSSASAASVTYEREKREMSLLALTGKCPGKRTRPFVDDPVVDVNRRIVVTFTKEEGCEDLRRSRKETCLNKRLHRGFGSDWLVESQCNREAHEDFLACMSD